MSFNPLQFQGTRWFDDIEYRPWIEVDRNKLGRVTCRPDLDIALPLREFQIERLLTEEQMIAKKAEFDKAMGEIRESLARMMVMRK